VKNNNRKHWNTEEMVKFLSDDRWKIKTQLQGGDWDSEELLMTAVGAKRGNHLYVHGFVIDTKEVVDTPGDFDIDMIAVSDGQDSRGGLNTDDEPTCLMYARIVSKLRKAGYVVVNTMDEYF